ncbi:putative peptidoglycan biosynthesis protein MurJ [Anaerohalosphaera lusitana]|uniref:Probable lipid II flippase MurJ n=1 Tax=Anaerohalosphaera lusitana TaxID=1936003 RepID=A0A1U9NKU3_9BACT|nr:murein biosynthesis integral membrane protein MurJ [Anaerohalosphaera lusitana]AQT68551.1 putative peptidoglycan biosynthesis protein MurJ [Anaerohalosphaera lusitana]
MIKGFKQIAVLTVFSRIFGLIRDMAYSYFLGAGGLMDAWTIAFRIPNLARRLFGEGAASASFIPVYSEELANDRESAARLANTVVTSVFIILAALVLIGWMLMGGYWLLADGTQDTRLILSLSSIMLPYALMVCLVAIMAGVLNVHKHFAAPAAAPIVLNFCIIGALIITGTVMGLDGRIQVFGVAAAVLLAGVLQIWMQRSALRKSGVKLSIGWDTNSAAFKKIIVLMGPMIIGLTVTQLNTLADDLIAWFFSGSEAKGDYFMLLGRQLEYPLWRGSVSHLYYSQRLYQFPLGVLGISLATAIFPLMSESAAKRDYDSLCLTIGRGVKGALFIAMPATVGLWLVADPLVAALFEHGEFQSADTGATSWTLIFYALGLCGYFSQQILTRAFYSVQDSKTPMRSAVFAVCVNIVLNLTLIWFMGTAGLAFSTAFCSYLQVAILILAMRHRFERKLFDKLGINLFRTTTATCVMAIVGWAAIKLMADLPNTTFYQVVRLAVMVPLAGGTYYICSAVLKNEMLSLFKAAKK